MRSDQIDIKLMTWGSIRITLDELIIALRHRLIVITYFACWAAIYPVRYRPDVPYLDIWREILIFLASQTVVILSLPVLVAFVARAKRHQPVPAVYISGIVFSATVLGCLTILACFWVFSGTVKVDFVTILIYAILNLVLTELVGALVMTFFLPTVLSDIRLHPRPTEPAAITAVKPVLIGRTPDPISDPIAEPIPQTAPDGAQDAMTTDSRGAGADPDLVRQPIAQTLPPPALAPGLQPVASDPAALRVADVVIAGKRVPKQHLRIIRAAGNYLDITLRADKMFVQATMRSVLQQMHNDDGLLLHRSLWLALTEVESFQRQGMDILVHTHDGETVKTARSRQSDVLAWLKQQSIPRRNTAA